MICIAVQTRFCPWRQRIQDPDSSVLKSVTNTRNHQVDCTVWSKKSRVFCGRKNSKYHELAPFRSYSCKSDISVVKFQAMSGAHLKNSLAEIYSVFRLYNVAMATTIAGMRATKGIVVSEVFFESDVPLIVHRKPTRLLHRPQSSYHAILLPGLRSSNAKFSNISATKLV